MRFLRPHIPAIQALCERHSVAELNAFGSVLREDFGPESDVDLLVVFQRTAETNAFQQYFGLLEDLENLLGREVELVSDRAIRNPYFRQEVDETKQPLYVAPEAEALL